MRYVVQMYSWRHGWKNIPGWQSEKSLQDAVAWKNYLENETDIGSEFRIKLLTS